MASFLVSTDDEQQCALLKVKFQSLFSPASKERWERKAGAQIGDSRGAEGKVALPAASRKSSSDGLFDESTIWSFTESPSQQLRETTMLGWFQALMPKEERFFSLFVRHATIVLAGAEALRGLLQGGDKIEHYCMQIFDREAEADEITRQVLTAVRRTFITPFDRTDIQDLINSMDDAIDQMNKTAKVITLFEVRSFEPQMQQMGEVIFQAATLILEAVPLLSSIGKNAGQLNVLTEKIISVEEHADQLYDEGRKTLFLISRQDAKAAMSFIIGAEIYDHLEKVVDRFEDVSNEINALVIDHL